MTTIGTNLSAMRAANASYAANKMVGTAMERLSTGKQINSARDNAAGLAIATSMTAQIRGMGQGIRNANDGVSMAQTAESVLGEATNMLQRIREITVQAANGTYGASDQKLIQVEVAQLTGQIGEMTATSEFNGVKLFATGPAPSPGFAIQVGANSSDVIVLNRPHIDGARLNTDAFDGLKVDVNTDRSSVPASMAYRKGASDAMTAAFTSTSIAAPSYGIVKQAAYDSAANYLEGVNRNVVPLSAGQVTLLNNIQNLKNTADQHAANYAAADPTAANYQQLGQNAHNSASAYLGAVKGFQVSYPAEPATVPDNLFYANGAADATAATQASVRAAGVKNPSLDVATGLAAAVYDTASAQSGRANAAETLKNVDALLQTVIQARSELGAGQAHLESAISNLTSQTTNLTDARSRIEDTNYSAETTALAKAQILSQASAAMLAQTNQNQQNVLSLLKGG